MTGVRTAAVLSHFDAAGDLAPYVRHHLEALLALGPTCLVSTSPVDDDGVAWLRRHGVHFARRPNRGFDFANWPVGIERLRAEGVDIEQLDALVLTNSSVVGPLAPLRPVIDALAAYDLGGMCDYVVPAPHLQSYFLVLRRQALSSASRFQSFFDHVLPFEDKAAAVLAYEVGLSRWATQCGLSVGALFPYGELQDRFYGRRWPLRRLANPSFAFAAHLIEQGAPYVKREALDGLAARPSRLRTWAEGFRRRQLLTAIAATDYPVSLLPPAGPPRVPTLR